MSSLATLEKTLFLPSSHLPRHARALHDSPSGVLTGERVLYQCSIDEVHGITETTRPPLESAWCGTMVDGRHVVEFGTEAEQGAVLVEKYYAMQEIHK